MQLKLYSDQKIRPPIQPFIVCLTYTAVDNDAKIITNILETQTEFRYLVALNDCFILGRGFRDFIQYET